jgi:prevent-host-death family protein
MFAGPVEVDDAFRQRGRGQERAAYLARARRRNEPIVVTHHGKPYALIQPLAEGDLEELEWRKLARKRLARAWEGEEDALYDYL